MGNRKTHIFFLGIGGIGMSALARYYHHAGYKISGYDRDKTELTKKLEASGISIVYEEESSLIENSIDFVVYTPAIKSDQALFKYFVDENIKMLKRSEALKELFVSKKVIAVAGTHGKTSTSALMAHVFESAAANVSAFIGGIMSNYGTNFIYGKTDWVIVEADEFDRSFWRLYPDVAVIQAIDADHLDIYETEENMVDAYRQFTRQIKKGGRLYLTQAVFDQRFDDSWKQELADNQVQIETFGFDSGDLRVENLEEENGINHFRFSGFSERVSLKLAGKHNVQNALGAISVARFFELEDETIKSGLESFKGIQRRFEYIVLQKDFVVIDDYAHHPKEIDAAINAAKKHHTGKEITVVFQPHLFSRTRDFMDDFALSLESADEVILVELYPAREKPIEGVDSMHLLERINHSNKHFVLKENLIDFLSVPKREVLLLLGAGDVFKMNREIENIYK